MIKKSTYIREFTPLQRQQLEAVAKAHPELKTVPDILFHTLGKYLEQREDIARLNRIIQYKQTKIEKLQENHGQ